MTMPEMEAPKVPQPRGSARENGYNTEIKNGKARTLASILEVALMTERLQYRMRP